MKPWSEILYAPLRPAVLDARAYTGGDFRRDLVAGLTVAVVAVPQAMAYALVAGVPMIYGLYTLIIQVVIGSIFASQPLLSGGPINTQSLLVAAIVARLAPGNPDAFLRLAIALALVKGLMQMALSFVRAGNLVRYVSQSVIIGFTAGAGVLIAAGQAHYVLGVSIRARQPNDLPGLLGNIQRIGPSLMDIGWDHAWRSLLIGGLTVLTVVIAKRISRLAPGPLLAVLVCGLLVAVLGWNQPQKDPAATQPAAAHPAVTLVQDLPDLGQMVDILALPRINWGEAEALIGGALALSLVGLMEAYSIGRTIAGRTGDTINANTELFSQGLSNAVSSFFQCFPGSASFSRSALNYYAGARTRFAGLYNAGFVALILLGYALLAHYTGLKLTRYVPMACLAGILFVIAYGLIDFDYFRRVLRADRSDAVVCLTTFIATLILPLEFAVFVGILLNIGLYVRSTSQLHISELVARPGGTFVERPLPVRTGARRAAFLQIEGELFFGVADELRQRLDALVTDELRVIILRLKRTHSIDSTVLAAINEFTQRFRARQGVVILCGVRPETMHQIEAFGLATTIGAENIFPADQGLFTSARAAIVRARQIVGASIDVSGLDISDEHESWSYEI